MVPPSSVGNAGLIHGKGTKISLAVGQLSPCTQLSLLCTLEPVCHYKRKLTCCSVDPGRQKKKKNKKKTKNRRTKKRIWKENKGLLFMTFLSVLGKLNFRFTNH